MANDSAMAAMLADALEDLSGNEPRPAPITGATAYRAARDTWGGHGAILRALGYKLGRPGTKTRREYRTANRALQRSGTGQHATLSDKYTAKIRRAQLRDWRELNSRCGIAHYMERTGARIYLEGWVRVSEDLRYREVSIFVKAPTWRRHHFARPVCAELWEDAVDAFVGAWWDAYMSGQPGGFAEFEECTVLEIELT